MQDRKDDVYKEELQKWCTEKKFSHFITIEPTPDLPFKPDEIRQRFRTIEFKVNKRYLGNSFTKWKNDEDKFYFIIFVEGDGIDKQKHYHALLHTPQNIMKKEFYYEDSFEGDLLDHWIMIPSKNPTTHKYRTLDVLRKICDIEKVTSYSASSRYVSKNYNAFLERLESYDEDKRFFFVTPPKSKKYEISVK
jgi:hypothetical protein